MFDLAVISEWSTSGGSRNFEGLESRAGGRASERADGQANERVRVVLLFGNKKTRAHFLLIELTFSRFQRIVVILVLVLVVVIVVVIFLLASNGVEPQNEH